jgi:YesN/AraC family two-component response regulator
VISAHEKFDFAKMSLRLGARDYFIKPAELDELIRVVGRVLREKRMPSAAPGGTPTRSSTYSAGAMRR